MIANPKTLYSSLCRIIVNSRCKIPCFHEIKKLSSRIIFTQEKDPFRLLMNGLVFMAAY